MIPRSYLYVPGDAPDKLAKSLSRGADAVIVDLEDSVSPSAKDTAREQVQCWLADLGQKPAGCEIWVRVNPGALGHADLRSVAGPALTGIMVAKTETADELLTVDKILTEIEHATGLNHRILGVVPLLESGAAVLRAFAIAGAPRVVRLQVGEADLAADLGLILGPDEREIEHIRSQVVLISAARGINPPVAPVSTNFRDLDLLRTSTRALARRGFVGRACIHPAQIAIANEVFTPTDAEVRDARNLVARFDAAIAAGRGVALSASGRMVDEAVARQARRVLARVRT